MADTNRHNPNNSGGKDKHLYIQYLRYKVLDNVGLTLDEFIDSYPEDKRFRLALAHVTSTKKAICKAFKIPVEAGCRYKRCLEKNALLVQSVKMIICPYTKHPAHELSCNPDEFHRLTTTNQLGLF